MGGQQFLKEYCQSVFIIPADYSFCIFQEFGTSISHRDAQAGVFDHGYVIDFVADGDDLLGLYAMSFGNMQNSLPFINGGVEDFDDADFSAAETMAENAFSENALQFGMDGLRYIGERDDADANRVWVRMACKSGCEFCRRSSAFKPLICVEMLGQFAADEIIHSCGFGVLQAPTPRGRGIRRNRKVRGRAPDP